jgi:pimeloyl-ACP methyl ester carboxylesterase
MRRPNPDTCERFFRQVVAHRERVRAAMGDRWAAGRAYHIDRTSQPSVRGANRQPLKGIGMRRIQDEELRTITVPVTLIWGKNDRVMRFKIAEEASAKFGWPLYSIDDCGHASVMERPDAVIEALRAAIDTRP